VKKFVLDVHLAKLARHLRMLGFDSLWKSDYTDPELLRVSAEEGRILLTRDRALWEMAPLSHYVAATDPEEQLVEVLRKFELLDVAREGRGFLTRCLQCNSVILPAKPHHVAHLIPGDILTRFDEFFFCPHCERVYWKGSHWDRMREWVAKWVG
jgi:uncharacterized protein